MVGLVSLAGAFAVAGMSLSAQAFLGGLPRPALQASWRVLFLEGVLLAANVQGFASKQEGDDFVFRPLALHRPEKFLRKAWTGRCLVSLEPADSAAACGWPGRGEGTQAEEEGAKAERGKSGEMKEEASRRPKQGPKSKGKERKQKKGARSRKERQERERETPAETEGGEKRQGEKGTEAFHKTKILI